MKPKRSSVTNFVYNLENGGKIFPCITWKPLNMKRDIQGKFALKNDDYRHVRALRLTEQTWKILGIEAECLGLTRADLVELRVREKSFLAEQTQDKQKFDADLLKLQEQIKLLQNQLQNFSEENTVLTALVLTKEKLSAIQHLVLERLKLGRAC